MDLEQDGKQQDAKLNTSQNLELSPESLDSSLHDIFDRVQGEGSKPAEDSY